MLSDKGNIDDIVKIFKEKNLKLTLQRINIYSYLMFTCEHPTVDTIYKNIKKSIPTISLATVYKTLNTLVDSGLVKMFNACEENFRYDANINPHGHIKCKKCNKIEDYNLDESFKNCLPIKSYKVEELDLFLYGVCKECSSELSITS